MPNLVVKRPERYPKYSRTLKLKAKTSDDEGEEDEGDDDDLESEE